MNTFSLVCFIVIIAVIVTAFAILLADVCSKNSCSVREAFTLVGYAVLLAMVIISAWCIEKDITKLRQENLLKKVEQVFENSHETTTATTPFVEVKTYTVIDGNGQVHENLKNGEFYTDSVARFMTQDGDFLYFNGNYSIKEHIDYFPKAVR